MVCTAVGAIIMLIQSVVAWLCSGRKIKINWKMTDKVLYGVFTSLVLGVAMCLILVWQKLLLGIVIGVVGIILLLMLIPMCLGLK